MHPDVKKLIDLQRIDQEIARINRDVNSLPAERARRQSAVDGLRSKADAALAQFQACEVSVRNTENSIRQADEELKKLEERLNTVKNNAEYQATLLQISSVKRERNAAENDGLENLEKVDELKEQANQAKSVVEEEEKVLAEFDQEAEKLKAQRDEQSREIRDQRAAAASDIPPELLSIYERLAPARDGKAVVPCEGDMCMGCYTQVSPNTVNRLHGGSSVVQCGACQCILYLA